jgi:hypothetical protein
MANITSQTVGSTTVGANYQTSVLPAAYGIRELTIYKITGYTAVATGAALANSTFAKIIRGVQTVSELWYADAPSANVVIVAISKGTEETKTSDDNGSNANAVATLKAAIEAVAGGTATVSSSGVFQTS